MLLQLLLPATFGAVAVAKPLYTVFYGQPGWLGLEALHRSNVADRKFSGLYTVLSSMIQASFKIVRPSGYFPFAGVVVKLVLQIPFILVFVLMDHFCQRPLP